MKKESSIVNLILNTTDDNKIIIVRLIAGLIFISEGIQQFLIVSMVGPELFKDAGFENPMFWADFTGAFEIACGILVLIGFLTRLASIPLLIIMITALITTKLPLLAHEDFWAFAHEYNIDFALTLLLIMLLISGGGKFSADLKIFRSVNSRAR
jgi:putative oxidoreductase